MYNTTKKILNACLNVPRDDNDDHDVEDDADYDETTAHSLWWSDGGHMGPIWVYYATLLQWSGYGMVLNACCHTMLGVLALNYCTVRRNCLHSLSLL